MYSPLITHQTSIKAAVGIINNAMRDANNFYTDYQLAAQWALHQSYIPMEDGLEVLKSHGAQFSWNEASEYLVRLERAYFIRKARAVLAMTQPELAEALELCTQTIGNAEAARSSIQLQTCLAVECLLRKNNKWRVFNAN